MPVEQKFRDIDEYIAAAPEDAAAAITAIRGLIHGLVPDVTERISYHMPLFELKGQCLTFVAAFKAHIGLYGISGVGEAFGERIAGYVNDKDALRFPLKAPMPLDLIAEILRFSEQRARTRQPRGNPQP
jgi:uncharacterized protein YdhG (YjbR/CyaY superfamily)